MQEGAFVLIDCLGFKGVWKRTDPELLLRKFSRLGPSMQERLSKFEILFKFADADRLRIHHRLLSDTVAISIQLERREDREYGDDDRGLLVFAACLIAPVVMSLFLEGDPPLVLRGCVTYGEHFIENNFIVGPAVDEAAEHMNLAEGAFVWLHPEAATMYRRFKESAASIITSLDDQSLRERIQKKKETLVSNVVMRSILESRGLDELVGFFKNSVAMMAAVPLVIEPYGMPIKNGGHLECAVINPLSAATSPEHMRLMMEKYAAVISGNRLDIWLKHQNTVKFLLEAYERAREFADYLRSQGSDMFQ